MCRKDNKVIKEAIESVVRNNKMILSASLNTLQRATYYLSMTHVNGDIEYESDEEVYAA